jgi:hypothetical protein
MAAVALERTLVKSPPELWDELSTAEALGRWLGTVQVRAAEPPHRLEWGSDVARGVIELETSGWGTKVRALADAEQASDGDSAETEIERQLTNLLDDLGSSSLTTG